MDNQGPTVPQEEQGAAAQPSPAPRVDHHYVKALVTIVIVVAVLAGFYLFGLSWLRDSFRGETAEDQNLSAEDRELAEIEAELQAMDVENSDKELNEIDKVFQTNQ